MDGSKNQQPKQSGSHWDTQFTETAMFVEFRSPDPDTDLAACLAGVACQIRCQGFDPLLAVVQGLLPNALMG